VEHEQEFKKIRRLI